MTIRYHVRRRDAAAVILLGLLQTATLIAVLLLIRSIVDSLVPNDVGAAAEAARRQTWQNLAILAVLAVVQGALRSWSFSIAEKAGYDVVRRLRMHMYDHLVGMTPQEVQRRARGGLLLRFIGDLSMLRMWVSRGILNGIVAAMTLLGALGVIAWLNLWMALAIVAVLSMGAALSLSQGRRMRNATARMRQRRSLVTGNIDEQLNNLAVVQVFGRASGERSRLSQQNDDLTSALDRMAVLRGRLRGFAATTNLLAIAAVLAVAVIEVGSYRASIGTAVAVVIITRHLNGPVRTLGLSNDYWHRAQISLTKIEDFFDSRSTGLAPQGLERLRVRKGRVQFEALELPGVSGGLTAEVEPGRIVALTGDGDPAAALLHTLGRLRDLPADGSAGQVLVDGQPLALTTRESAYRAFGFVAPDLPLMKGTIRRNLTYGAPKATDEEVQRVCFLLNLDTMLNGIDEGLSGWVTEGGRNLSANQRQLIAMGRALMNNPHLLVLDQPTAGLDPMAAADVREVLARYRGTIFMVTNDAADLAIADEVWHFVDGEVRVPSRSSVGAGA